MSYTLFRLDTGEVCEFGTGDGPPAPPDGFGVHADALSNLTHYFSAGVPVEYTQEQAQAKASRPSSWHFWSNVAMAWEDTRTLDDLKASKNTEINEARLAANRGTFAHGGKTFACDELSRGDIDGVNGIVALTGGLPAGWPGAWKAVDNTYLTIADAAAWTAFYGAMVAQGTANFAHSQVLKAQLAAATTVAEIEAVVW